MNEAIKMLKREAAKRLPPKPAVSENYTSNVDSAGDEIKLRDLLTNMGWGSDWKCTADRNKMERWDVEGLDPWSQTTRLELKSRPAFKSKYKTWIVDMYKVDWMLENFPFDNNYFVNSCEGKFHVYDMNYIRNCQFRKGVWSKMENGRTEQRDFYYVPKEMYMIELTTGILGGGSDLNEVFKNKLDEKSEEPFAL